MDRYIFLLFFIYEAVYESFKMGMLSGTYSEYVILFLAYTILMYCLRAFKYSFDINLLFIILLVLVNLITSVRTYEGYYEIKFLLMYWIRGILCG